MLAENLPNWELELFTAFLAGREDVYVANASAVVREPVTPDVLRYAHAHRYPISTYMAAADGTTHVAALDIDREDGMAVAEKVQAVLYSEGIWSLRVQSRRGAHLWLGLSERVRTGIPRRALLAALARVHPGLTRDLKVEIFPKVGTNELACGALRLPGFPHQKTQQVYPVFAPDGQWTTELHQILEWWKPADMDLVKSLASHFSPPTNYPHISQKFYRARKHYENVETPKASVILQSWGVPRAQPGRTIRCPKHDDKHQSLTIFRDDARVFCGQPECPLNGGGHGVGSVMLERME